MTQEEQDPEGGSFDYNEEDLKINEQEIQDEGLMHPLEAIAQLFKMEDMSGTLGELHAYFSGQLQNTQDALKAADIAKTLQELSGYILSWEYAEDTYEKPFLSVCKKLIGTLPKAKIENFEAETVNTFLQKAVSLEPAMAARIEQAMQKETEEMEE